MDVTKITDLIRAQLVGIADELDLDPTRIPAVDHGKGDGIPVVRRVSDIPEKSLGWVWPGWIPAGMLTVLGGHVGDGKSTLVAAITAALTTGAPLPDGAAMSAQNVLILSGEDDAASIIRPRLAANNADLDRVFILDGFRNPFDPDSAPERLELRHMPGQLHDIVTAHDIRLVIIDPLGSFLRRSDRASEGAIRDALQPLMNVIADTGVAVLGVMRVGKSGGPGRPAQRLVGSSAVPAIARSVIMLARVSGVDDDEPGRVVLQVVKGNYARPPQPLAVEIHDNGAVRWLGPVDAGIDELAQGNAGLVPSGTDRADAVEFLREYLAGEDAPAADVLAQAKKLGMTDITIRRAKKEAGVTSYRDPDHYGRWTWHLPLTDEDPALDDHRCV